MIKIDIRIILGIVSIVDLIWASHGWVAALIWISYFIFYDKDVYL